MHYVLYVEFVFTGIMNTCGAFSGKTYNSDLEHRDSDTERVANARVDHISIF